MNVTNNKYFKRWLTPDEVSEEFGFGLDMQAKLRQNNQIPYSKINSKKILYDRKELNKWLESHSVSVSKKIS